MADDVTMESLGFVDSMGSPGSGRGTESGGVRSFFGKYRGAVRSNLDPQGRCRLLINVTDVHGPNITSWAMPCLPYGGLQLGSYVVPPVGAGVWVEFEHGDPDYPIWSGCWWGVADAPLVARSVTPSQPVFLLMTPKQAAIGISDTPIPALMLKEGGVILSAGPQSYIAIEPSGITIVGPKVDVNLGALLVT
jgi:hypothetical protein